MKQCVLMVAVLLAFSCGEPVHVTGNPDNDAATTGTLGNANSEKEIPRSTRDTAARRDTTANPNDRLH